uniref:Uncharacterized protein n=1 Tax=Rhizophora mucronata TaxID=61149 RepID=A0A2P2QYE5_RHIMU
MMTKLNCIFPSNSVLGNRAPVGSSLPNASELTCT